MFKDSLYHCNLYVVSIEMYHCLKSQNRGELSSSVSWGRYAGGKAEVRGRGDEERGGRKEETGMKREVKGGRWVVVCGHHHHALLEPALIAMVGVVVVVHS